MNRIFQSDPRIKKLAEVCDAIKASREAAGRETWNDAERRAFVAAAKMCGASFPSFNAPAGTTKIVVQTKDEAERRIRERERQERAARQARLTPKGQGRLVYASDDDENPLEIR